jgi:hypothetical protein
MGVHVLTRHDHTQETTGMSFLPTRRNTSFAGLGPAREPPSNLQQSLYLLCVTAPEVAVTSEETAVLQASVTAREEGYFQQAAALSRHNPPLFAALGGMGDVALEAVRAGLKHLKNHCRLEAKAAWHGVKLAMETRLHDRLQVRAHPLRGSERTGGGLTLPAFKPPPLRPADAIPVEYRTVLLIRSAMVGWAR